MSAVDLCRKQIIARQDIVNARELDGTTPWLDVLLPVYNGAATLSQTLDSVVRQQEGVHIVLVDQGSTDGSRDIAAGFLGKLNMTIIDAPQNKNWVQNTNLALASSHSPFACLLHQDDIWAEGRTRLVRAMIQAHPDASLWVHGADYIDSNGRLIGSLSPPLGRRAGTFGPEETALWLLVQNTIALPAAVFRRSDALAIGGLKETLWYTADWDLWLGLALRGPLAWRPERAARFRLHRGSLTLSGSRVLEDFTDQLARPLRYHLAAVPQPQRNEIERLALTSNMINVWLASRFHKHPLPVGPVLRRLASLGPVGLIRLLRRTQILARLSPRLRLMKGSPLSFH